MNMRAWNRHFAPTTDLQTFDTIETFQEDHINHVLYLRPAILSASTAYLDPSTSL